MTKPWLEWNRFDWSDALLESYFGVQAGRQPEPVRILVVTDDRLCQVVGEPVAAPETVRLALISKTLRSIGEMNYWKHAWEQRADTPSYLAHLIVACIAAVDSSDADERSYLRRFQEIAGPSADHSIELMPDLWLRLQQWLADRPDEYRPLVLPDPRGWVRIGHTTRLAFPSRPDQTRLRQLLADQDLGVEELPLGMVVKALEGKRRGFSQRFIEELDAFENARRAGATAAALYGTPLWSAVTSASMLDVEDRQADATQRWTLVGLDDGYELDLHVVTNGEDASASFQVVELEEPFGYWTHELRTSEEGPTIDVALKDSSLHLGNLSALARGGVLPFIQAAHGAMEIASKQDFDFVTVLVVADGCVDEVQQRFGGKASGAGCGVAGWSVIRNVRLRTSEPEELEGSVLERCWILHNTPFPASLRLVGGVRIGDAYLGKRSTLPRVVAMGASQVTAAIDDFEVDLDGLDGYWSFPARALTADVDGTVVIRGYISSGNLERRIRFVSSPATESFKAPGDASAWQVEGAARSQSMASSLEMYARALQPVVANVDRLARLGRDVGVFANGPGDTTWEITTFGTTRCGRLVQPVAGASPTRRSPSDGDRRRWRKALSGARFDEGDPARGVARSILAGSRSAEDLPVTANAGEPVVLGDLVPCREVEHSGLQDLVEIMCAISNRSAGVETAFWRRLCQEALGLDWPQFKAVSRAWSEANLFDELVSRRWSTRKVLAVQPHLVVFQTDRWVGATLQGLSLGVTRRHLKEASAAASVLVETIRSRSGLIPETVSLRANSMEPIESVAQQVALPIRWLRSEPFHIVGGRDLTITPPGNYERSSYGHGLDDFDEVTVDRWWKGGSPGLWTVAAAEHRTWTHYEYAAGFWAAAFAGHPIVELAGRGRLRRDGAHLPLTVARWLNAIAPVLSGPDPAEDGAHVYECPSTALCDELRAGLNEFIKRQMTELATRKGSE